MPKQKTPEAEALPKAKDEPWPEEELQAAVMAYFDMQRKYDRGEKINKAKVYRDLAVKFPRSAGAFEFRMQNISYVLQEMGRDWLTGLKPAKNVGATNHPIIERLILAANPVLPPAASPPERLPLAKQERQPYQVPPLPAGVAKPEKVKAEVTQIARDPKVREWVLVNANGHCECCLQPAPFKSREDGQPFLEIHHLVLLAEDGPDTVANAVALCPNCHRELHHGENGTALREQLYARIPHLKRGQT